MKMGRAILASVAFSLGATPVATAYAAHDEQEENEHEVSLASIPAPARQALLANAAGAPILKVEQRTENGKTLYSVHVKTKDGILEITVNAAGVLVRKGPEYEPD
jgi:hypothetical protein